MPPPRRSLLVVLLVIVVGCGSQPTTTVEPSLRPVDRLVSDEPIHLPPTTTAAHGTTGTQVVRSVTRVFHVHPRPGAQARTRTLAARNDWGQRLELPVVGRRSRDGVTWLQVRLPERPNGSRGWLRAAAVRVGSVDQRIVVDLSDHVLERWEGRHLLARFRVATGAPSTPTTPGRFFVWAQVAYENPAGAYGAFALGLSGFSEVITEWPGGGRMAIHGTIDPSHLGRDISHGCVRVLNSQMLELRDVPLGTPVLIRP